MSVIAYAFEADIHCLDCTRDMFFDPATMDPTWDVEAVLDAAAKARGIDRYDESSYNSCRFPGDDNPFPKVCLSSDSDVYNDRCGNCRMRIADTL